MKRKISWFAVLLLQVLLLLGMAWGQTYTEAYGKSITLRTEPVDPKDLIYGDYVMLHYEISTVPVDWLQEKGVDPFKVKSLYVLLRPEGDVYQVERLYMQKPSVSEGQVVLKARVQYVDREFSGSIPKAISFHLFYGFERYYAAEDKAKDLEKKRGQFNVVVKVSPWGQKLSSLKFIATDVLSAEEIRQRVMQKNNEKQKFDMINFRLDSDAAPFHRPCWIVTVAVYDSGKTPTLKTLTLDAKTGEILQETPVEK